MAQSRVLFRVSRGPQAVNAEQRMNLMTVTVWAFFVEEKDRGLLFTPLSNALIISGGLLEENGV